MEINWNALFTALFFFIFRITLFGVLDAHDSFWMVRFLFAIDLTILHVIARDSREKKALNSIEQWWGKCVCACVVCSRYTVHVNGTFGLILIIFMMKHNRKKWKSVCVCVCWFGYCLQNKQNVPLIRAKNEYFISGSDTAQANGVVIP